MEGQKLLGFGSHVTSMCVKALKKADYHESFAGVLLWAEWGSRKFLLSFKGHKEVDLYNCKWAFSGLVSRHLTFANTPAI